MKIKEKKTFIIGLVGITVSIVFAVFVLMVYKYYPTYRSENKYSQEYIAGQGNIKGDVDKEMFECLGRKYEIGANQYGYAVFKDPESAYKQMKMDYNDGIELIQDEFDLEPLSKLNYKGYETYGAKVTTGTEEAREQASFVSYFLAIFDNSLTINE